MKFKLDKNNTKLILTESTREEINQLRHSLSPYVDNYRFMQKFKLGVWDGKINFMNQVGEINFGLWQTIHEICKNYGYPFNIVNKEQFPRDNNITLEQVQNFCDVFFKNHKDNKGNDFRLYKHQINAIYLMLKHKYCCIEVATSGGKSAIFSAFVFYILKHINPNAKILLIVTSLQLVTQFYDDLLDYNLGFNKENTEPIDLRIQEIMSDKPRKVRDGEEPNIYIGTYQSLIKYGTKDLLPDFFKQFDVVCSDEAHKCKSVSLVDILSRTFGYAKYRCGMSGTYPKKDSAELLTILSVVGPIVCSVKAKELMDSGIISNVKIKALILQYEDNQFAEAVYSIKKNGNGKRAYDLEREYATNSEKRKIFISKLLQKCKQNTMILFHNIEYGTLIYDYLRNNIIGFDFYYIDGETSTEKRNYIKKQMEITDDGKVKVLVSSFGTTAVGLSIKAITNLIFAQGFKADSLIRQSIGRVLRLHAEKSKAIVFDLVDQFSHKYKNILYNQYITRRDSIYKQQEFPMDEIKIVL